MKGLKLRTQLLLIVAFIELYTIGVGLSYWVQANAQERLEYSFRQDLAVLTKLPRLRDTLRELDDSTGRYLLVGRRENLERRSAALARLRAQVDELTPLMESPQAAKRLLELESGLASYVAEQEQWISLRQNRRLSRADAERLATLNSPFEDLSSRLTDLKDVSARHLRERRQVVQRASLLALGLVLFTGLVSSLLLALFLSRYLIGPVLRLEESARGWQLGAPWTLTAGPAGPEVASLIGCMGEMAERLNKQFRHERELNKFKSQLVSMISHEFNNAMTVIVGATALLEDSDNEPKEQRERYLKMIKDSVRTLTMASSNLLNMGRLESGRFALSPRETEVRQILRQTADRLEVLSRQKRLAVSLELPEPPIPVRADPEALTLVLTNLLSNAIKYTPGGGSVTLGLARVPETPDQVEVFCRDTGIGISPEDKDRILTGYFRTESGKKAAKGFGVGLALANGLVDAHGSRLRIESEPGKGSRFSFRLPVWSETAPSAENSMTLTLPSPELGRGENDIQA